MTRADASSYKSIVSENTPLLERGAGSWWDRHRTPLVASALLLFTAIVFVVGVRLGAGTSAALGDSSGMVPMISPIGNEEFGRTLVGVLGTEGLGIAYQTMVNYECLARRLGRRLVMVPLVTEHFDDVPLDLAELFQFDDGDMVPLSQAPHDIMARVWTQYGNGESTNQWVHGGSYGAASVYFSKYLPGVYPPGTPARRGVWECDASDTMRCAEALAAQAEAKGEEELVTVFSDAHFCGVETGDTPRPKAKVTMSPPNEILSKWIEATGAHFSPGSGLSTLHWRRGDRCTSAQISSDPSGRAFACSDFDKTPIPAMCADNHPLYIATDDFDPDFQASLLRAGCFTYPQVFGNTGVNDAFGSFLLDIMTMSMRTERTFFVLGGSSDNPMLAELQDAMGAPVPVKEITATGSVPVSMSSA